MSATASTTILSSDANTIANILYVVVGGMLGIAGSIVSAYFSRGWRKEDRLIRAVYEPMLAQLARILEQVEQGKRPDVGEFERLGKKPETLRIDGRVKRATERFYACVSLYPAFYDAAKAAIDGIVKEEIKKCLATHAEEIPHQIHQNVHLGKHDLAYKAFRGDQLVGEVALARCLLLGKEALDVLREECAPLMGARIDCLLGGLPCKTELCNEIVKSALEAAKKDTMVQNARAMRELLMSEERSPAQPLSDLLRRRVSRIWPWQRLT